MGYVPGATLEAATAVWHEILAALAPDRKTINVWEETHRAFMRAGDAAPTGNGRPTCAIAGRRS
jgi:hypothetical protein